MERTEVAVPTGTGSVDHPLAALTRHEITAAVAALRSDGRVGEEALIAYVGLAEPDKEAVRRFLPGDPVDRRVKVVALCGPESEVTEAVVSVPDGAVRRCEVVRPARPALAFEESMRAIDVLKADPRWREAMARRGITDVDQVQIDPWPAGSFGLDHEEGRRITRCLSYYRESPGDNGYARPVEGVIGFVDMGRGEVLEVVDHGVVPLPPQKGSYYPEDAGERTDLKPLAITQPTGPSFTVEGNLVRWQRWSFRVSMDPLEGLVLRTLGYEDQGRVRPVLYRAAISEMVVPYGTPDPMHAWKNAFDAGEWGLGRMANSLRLGCDCLGEIHYFDADYADERGKPHTLRNAICMHEEDYGILWKHTDMHTGRIEVRRSRRLVVSSIATVGNYEYGFYWYLYLDGTVQLEVKLTGIMSTQALAPGAEPDHASMVAPQLAAPVHQHLFNVRLDMEVDGPATPSTRWRAGPIRPGPTTPGGTPSRRWPPCSRPSWPPNGWSTRPPAVTGGSPTAARPTPSGGPPPTSWCRARCPPSWPTRARAWAAGPASPPRTSGSPPTTRPSCGRPATTPTSTRAQTACPAGRRPTGRSSTATWWCGTPSGSPTSPGPRTGR